MFRTRYAPVRHSCIPEGTLPFDLHVLGLPLAFILSQDQTLQTNKSFFQFSRKIIKWLLLRFFLFSFSISKNFLSFIYKNIFSTFLTLLRSTLSSFTPRFVSPYFKRECKGNRLYFIPKLFWKLFSTFFRNFRRFTWTLPVKGRQRYNFYFFWTTLCSLFFIFFFALNP